MSRTPKKFVGLHSHTHFSIGDGLGTPEEHIKFAIENGMDALAVTDHGNMNAYSHQQIAAKRYDGSFFAVPGIEAYFIPSLTEWAELKLKHDAERAQAREAAKRTKSAKKKGEILTELPKDIADSQTAMAKDDIEDTLGGATIENEAESKSNKYMDPIRQRSHLVLLPKNREGLESLFRLVSESYINGFYRYPRIDYDLLKKYANGNIIALSACVGSLPGHYVFKHQGDIPWDELKPSDTNFELIQSELKEMTERFQDALGGKENFYLELQFNKLPAQHLLNQHLIELHRRTGAPLVSTADAHYARPELWREREIYKMMAWMNKSKDAIDKDALPKAIDELKCELYPKNAEQMWQSYKETTAQYDFYDDELVSNSIEQSWKIAHEQIDKHNLDLDRSVKLPALHKIVGMKTLVELDNELQSLGNDYTEEEAEDALAFQALKKQAIEGLVWRKKANDQEYIDRLRKELLVVKELKFAKYFLTYSKVMEIVTKHMLTGPARGSAAGSLLSFVLNITQTDPIRYGLLFERFLTIHKKGSFPDIDSDVGDRDLATKLITEHFGETDVLAVSSFSQLRMRSLIKDVLKLEGVPYEEVNSYTSKVENEALAVAKKKPGFDGTTWELSLDEAKENSPTFREILEKYPDIEPTLDALLKAMRSLSRHAGGLIITNDGINKLPIIKSGGVLQTPWPEGVNYRHLESFGFLKFDILGLGTLRIFENCIARIIRKETGKNDIPFSEIYDWYYKNLHPDNNALDDIKVYKNIYWRGRFAGTFQFVNTVAQNFVRQLRPKSIIELATATSIVRPGPLAIQADRMYLENRTNPQLIQYKHPLLKEVLEDTCGLIIFQEQLQLIYHKLAGVPLDETDNVRKAFTKKDLSNLEEAEKARKALRDDFIVKCKEANDIDPKISGSIFDELEKFVAYSFNKSHAVSYAIVSYMCAYLLTYYPDEWIAAYIDYSTTDKGRVTGKEDPKAVALSEAQQLGYNIGKPDINLCEQEFVVKDGTIIPSFASLKYCGVTATAEIMKHRPYNKLTDLFINEDGKWRHSKFNKRSLATLIKLEALDTMELVGKGEEYPFKNYKQFFHVAIDHFDELKRLQARKRKEKTLDEFLTELIEQYKDVEDWSIQEKVQHSIELAGSVNMGLVVTPKVREYLSSLHIRSIDQWKDDGAMYWAVVTGSSVNQTKTGKHYLRAKLTADGSEHQAFFWNFNTSKHTKLPEYTLVLGKFKRSDFGFTCYYNALETIMPD